MRSASPLAPNLQKRLNLKFHFGKIYDVAWSPNSDRLVTAAQDGKLLVRFFLSKTCCPWFQFNIPPPHFPQVWNGHGVTLAGDRGAVIHAVTLKSPWVQSVALADNLTASGGLDNTVTLFRLQEEELEITKCVLCLSPPTSLLAPLILSNVYSSVFFSQT